MSETSSLPLFSSNTDPGPSFSELLRQVSPHQLPGAGAASGTAPLDVPHGTTVVAIRYADGVVMAGDRRATAGYTIASRRIEKVFAADDFSGVAIAGAAGPAIEMVKLFQTQLEHYEKVQGEVLSLEGKANQLGMLVRGNLPAAMQGLAVVPLFAGYDQHREIGRVFSYDVTGGRYEERDYQGQGRAASTPATGSRPAGPKACRSTTPSPSRSARCSRPPTKTSQPAGPISCAASSRSSPRSMPTASAPSTTPTWSSAAERSSKVPSGEATNNEGQEQIRRPGPSDSSP